jgi:hypothetical protein
MRRVRLELLILILFLLACATSYKESISQWKSHEDVASWMESNFTKVLHFLMSA